MFQSSLDVISKGVTNLIEFVKSIPVGVWNLFQFALDGISKGITSILDFFINFFDNMLSFLKNIFVPGDNYFVDNYNSLNTAMSGKIGVDTSVLEELKGASSMSTFSDPSFLTSFKIMGVNVTLDYSVISKIRNITLVVSNGLMVIFLCWYNVRKVIWIIRGTEPIQGNGGGSK